MVPGVLSVDVFIRTTYLHFKNRAKKNKESLRDLCFGQTDWRVGFLGLLNEESIIEAYIFLQLK